MCWDWVQDAIRRRINVTGPMIKEKGLKFAADLDNESFKASNGWLDCFLKRHNIVFGKMSGERDVNETTMNEWKEKLPQLCEGYKSENIFNMDETGLFFRDTTRYTFHKKGDDCAGGKRSKERLTVALCASMTGEKLRPLVIGKSEKPRCFKKINVESLPVDYKFNRKAWMNSHLFEIWLKKVNRIMVKKQRNILMFIDNAPSHPSTLNLSNVRLQFFPPNTTSKSQPMDQGIIQAMKLKFRKKQLLYLIREMNRDKEKCGSTFLKQITYSIAFTGLRRLGRKWTSQPFRSVSRKPDLLTLYHILWMMMMIFH